MFSWKATGFEKLLLKSFESEPRPESTAGSLLLSTWDGLVGELLHIHAMMMMMNVDDDDFYDGDDDDDDYDGGEKY